MRGCKASLLVLALALSLVLMSPGWGFVGPRFVDLGGDYRVVSISADYADNVCVAVEGEDVMLLYRGVDGAVFEVKTAYPVDAVSLYGGYCVAYSREGGSVVVVNAGDFSVETIEVSYPVEYITSSRLGMFYLTSPVAGVVYSLDPAGAGLVDEYKLSVASGAGVISVYEKTLWALLEDYKTILVLDTETGEGREYSAGIQVTSILAVSDSEALVTDTERILRLNKELGFVGEVEIEGASFIAPPLVVMENGWVVYVSSSKRMIWVMEGGSVIESNKLRGFKPVSPSAGKGLKLWLVDDVTGRLAYVSLSREPYFFDWRVAVEEEGALSVFFKVSDPDGDLDPGSVGVRFLEYDDRGILVRNVTVGAEDMGEGYGSRFRPLERSWRVDVFGVASDYAGNFRVVKLGEVDVKRIEEGGEVVVEEKENQPPIDPQITVLLFSGLLLMLPLLIALSFRLSRRGGRRRR